MTAEELCVEAYKNNWTTLHEAMNLTLNPSNTVSLSDALEAAAIMLSRENKYLKDELIRIHQTS